MAEVKVYWIGEIRDCPIELPGVVKDRPGVVLLTNTRSDDALYELMEYCEPFEEHGREFDDWDMYYSLKWEKRKRCVAWVIYEKKPPELDIRVRNLLMDLIVDKNSAEAIYNMLTLAPWMIEALARPIPVDEVEGA